jgi:A/G-specific adenine glycosylase
LHTPVERVAQYTQAIMDLGATLCTRRQPRCAACPFVARCAAHAAGAAHDFPAPKKPLQRRAREVWMLLARRADGSVRLVQRPAQGVWGGLWSPPEYPTRDDAATALSLSTGATQNINLRDAEPLQHAFTHFDLTIYPLWADAPMAAAAEEPGALWYNAARPAQVGLPAPIAQLLQDPP